MIQWRCSRRECGQTQWLNVWFWDKLDSRLIRTEGFWSHRGHPWLKKTKRTQPWETNEAVHAQTFSKHGSQWKNKHYYRVSLCGFRPSSPKRSVQLYFPHLFLLTVIEYSRVNKLLVSGFVCQHRGWECYTVPKVNQRHHTRDVIGGISDFSSHDLWETMSVLVLRWLQSDVHQEANVNYYSSLFYLFECHEKSDYFLTNQHCLQRVIPVSSPCTEWMGGSRTC